MTLLEREEKKRQLDNYLAQAINVLQAVKNQHNVTLQDKLKALETVQRHLPYIRRMVMFLGNTNTELKL